MSKKLKLTITSMLQNDFSKRADITKVKNFCKSDHKSSICSSNIVTSSIEIDTS